MSGATIQLYAASIQSTGTAQAATALLTGFPVITDAGGGFNISSMYTCPSATTPVYIVATGGNPGVSSASGNDNLAMMAALGNCGDLTSSSFIVINEVTTAATAAAIAPFSRTYNFVASLSTDAAALGKDFQIVKSLEDSAHGSAPGTAAPSGYTVDVSKINGLADAAAACINSEGNAVAGDSSPCGRLFQYATPPDGVAPTNVVDALLDIARFPTHNVSQIYSLISPTSPFQPTPSSTPSDWRLVPQSALFSPAVITTLTLSSSSDFLPAGNSVAWNDPKVLNSGVVSPCGVGYPGGYSGCSNYVSNDEGEVNAYIDINNATDFYIYLSGSGKLPSRIFIDGVPFNPLGQYDPFYVYPPLDGGFYNLHLSWSARASHKIRFENEQRIYGYGTDTQATIVATTTTLGHRVEVIGDSYVEPAYSFVGFTEQLGDVTGWEMLNSGDGGTGLIASDAAGGRGNYQSRVQSDVCALHPDELIVYGSVNDGGHTASEEQAAAHTLVSTVRTCSPKTDIILLGPICPAPGSDCAATKELAKGLQAEATADGLPFIDPTAEDWLTIAAFSSQICTGSFGNNCSDYSHPTQAGHNAIAARLLADLRAVRPKL